MASYAVVHPRADAVSHGYRTILVPVTGDPVSERAVEVACQLAAERHAGVTVVTVIEVPQLLPLDARMDEEEFDVRRAQQRAEAIADGFGVPMSSRHVRARNAGAAILDELGRRDYDLVVLGAARKIRVGRLASPFGRTVRHVLRGSDCRVMLVAPPG